MSASLLSLRQHGLSLDDRSALIVFRLIIFLLLTFFLLYSPEIEGQGRLAPFSLMVLYLLSDVLLLKLPAETLKSTTMRGAILLFDIGVITSVIYLSQGASTDLYLAYFLVIFMSSLDARLSRSFLTATVACAIYMGLALQAEVDWTETSFLLRIPFFYLVSFFSSFMAAQARDETERVEQRYKTRLETAERRVALGRLAREIGRELGDPLRVIEGLSMALLRAAGPEDSKRPTAESISFEAQRCSELLRRFLMLTGDKVSPFGFVELNQAASAAIDALSETKKISAELELKLELAENLPPVRGDKAELTLAIRHLAQNAIEAMPLGGTLTVRTRIEPRLEGGPRTVVEVLDTGVGIPEFAGARLFEPFFTTKRRYEKAGLGLCFVSAIVERHRGEISVHTTAGQGSRFTLSFPQAPAP